MTPPLRYLSADEVRAAMPGVAERIALAERTMVALVDDAELPPKMGVHLRESGSFAHAMPAWLRPGTAGAEGGAADLLGLKWVSGMPSNRARGLPVINAVVVLNDGVTGVPRAILDGGPITALRTAAVSGAAIRHFAPVGLGRPVRATIIGAGVQGHSHLEVLAHVLPGVELTIVDRHPDRAEALASAARATDGIGGATVAADPRAASLGADVVVTVAAFTEPAQRQVMDGSWLGPDALVVPVDYATMCAASVAREASLFAVDDRDQFLAVRDEGQFDDYPDPVMMLGEAIRDGFPRPPTGRVVVTHLGVGLADVVFADAIVRQAERDGLGTMLGG